MAGRRGGLGRGDRASGRPYGALCPNRRDWWAVRGEGAFVGPAPAASSSYAGARSKMLGLETARPSVVAEVAPAAGQASRRAASVRSARSRLRHLPWSPSGQLDAMLSPACGAVRRRGGGSAARDREGAAPWPSRAATRLDLDMRSRAVAARSPDLVERLLGMFKARIAPPRTTGNRSGWQSTLPHRDGPLAPRQVVEQAVEHLLVARQPARHVVEPAGAVEVGALQPGERHVDGRLGDPEQRSLEVHGPEQDPAACRGTHVRGHVFDRSRGRRHGSSAG